MSAYVSEVGFETDSLVVIVAEVGILDRPASSLTYPGLTALTQPPVGAFARTQEIGLYRQVPDLYQGGVSRSRIFGRA